MSKEGRFVFHRLAAVDVEGKRVDLLKEQNRLRKSGQMRLEIQEGRGHFVSTGNDPHFIFSADDVKRIEFEVTIFVSDSVEVFVDTGSSFNRREMIARHLSI